MVFLTPDSTAPDYEGYVAYGYAGIVATLEGLTSSPHQPVPAEKWDEQLRVIKGDPAKLSRTGRGLLFEIKTYINDPGRVNVSLIVGPGDADVRTKVYAAARSKPHLFQRLVTPMGEQYATIFSRDLLTSHQAQGQTFEAQEFNVRAAWSAFQGDQLGTLINAILEIDEQLGN